MQGHRAERAPSAADQSRAKGDARFEIRGTQLYAVVVRERHFEEAVIAHKDDVVVRIKIELARGVRRDGRITVCMEPITVLGTSVSAPGPKA